MPRAGTWFRRHLNVVEWRATKTGKTPSTPPPRFLTPAARLLLMAVVSTLMSRISGTRAALSHSLISLLIILELLEVGFYVDDN